MALIKYLSSLSHPLVSKVGIIIPVLQGDSLFIHQIFVEGLAKH